MFSEDSHHSTKSALDKKQIKIKNLALFSSRRGWARCETLSHEKEPDDSGS
jgi:hypothetical protein